ncbi:hypothetical protein NKR19_g5030 [Coniochaeta hoffmannii]|uniref:Uncharacterized protein n=1 Tax=Coniochaeta hoffmannii TaxID=91930 RepID=A0AA38RLS7_9PEZI|nr:hypothetical protein NKR19_g5030 [Coniochaeta hoffmannii]
MVGSALTLALIGLGAVSSALPTGDNAVKERQIFGFGSGGSSFGTGSGQGVQCNPDVPLTEQPPCILTVIGGTFKPPKGKRFTLPPDANTNKQHAIDTLELQLEALQNKKHKTHDDYEEIADIKAALQYLAGITSISAPPGTGTIFHPGKRSELTAPSCPDSLKDNLDGLELAYESLLHQDHLSFQEIIIKEKLKSALLGCGITIVKSPDGTSTILKPSDKRDVYTADFDLVGLEKAYEQLIQSLGSSKPSFTTWLAIQHMESLLKLYGITIEQSPAGTTTTLRPGKTRRQTFTIGTQTCQLSDIISLKAALATLYAAYGDPRTAPQNIFLIEQVIVSYLTLCGQTVNGWTTLTPGNPIPGGPITPDPTQPGGPIIPDPTHPGGGIVPDPTTPGGEIHPSDRRQAPISDPSALLAALQLLESKYGGYGSGTIPVPVFLIMENIVTILQDIPGVTVPGWPMLGAGSTGGIKPSD